MSQGPISTPVDPFAHRNVDVGRDQGPEPSLGKSGRRHTGHDAIEPFSQRVRAARICLTGMGGRSHLLQTKRIYDAVFGLFEVDRIEEEGVVQIGEDLFYLLFGHQHTPLLPHQRHLQFPYRHGPVKEGHEPIEGHGNRPPFRDQSQVVTDQNQLLSPVFLAGSARL